MDGWVMLARFADFVGIVSFSISVVTLVITSKIRKNMLAHVEKSEYRIEIDEQIGELEAFKALLLEEKALNPDFFLQLNALLKNINIAYETILPSKLKQKIKDLSALIKDKLYQNPPYSRDDIDECISLLVYVSTELKKEKKVL